MSRGPGRCQQRIIAMLKEAPMHRMSREKLDEMLVGKAGEGYDPSNLLRSIRGMERERIVTFKDDRHKTNAIVALTLAEPVDHITDDKIADLLSEIGGHDK